MSLLKKIIKITILFSVLTLLITFNSSLVTSPVNAENTTIISSDVRCLAKAIYHEARDQSITGKIAVGLVVLNRTEHYEYPNTVCGVVFHSMKRGSCQFSWACKKNKPINEKSKEWVDSVKLAEKLINNTEKYQNLAPGALYFHAKHVSPNWSRRLKYITTIGDHKFYRGRT